MYFFMAATQPWLEKLCKGIVHVQQNLPIGFVFVIIMANITVIFNNKVCIYKLNLFDIMCILLMI